MKKLLLPTIALSFFVLAPLAHASTITPTSGTDGAFTFTPTATVGGFERFYDPSGNTYNPTNSPRICTGTNNGVSTLTCNLAGYTVDSGSVYGQWSYEIYDSGGSGIEGGHMYLYSMPPPPPPPGPTYPSINFIATSSSPTSLIASVVEGTVSTGDDIWAILAAFVAVPLAFYLGSMLIDLIGAASGTQKKK